MDSADDASRYHEQRLADGERCLESALYYLSLGWSVLALCPPDHAGVGKMHGKACKSKGKVPIGLWKEFQDRLPTEQEVRGWWDQHPTANLGMALGPVSGLLRIDVEGVAGEARLQELSKGDLPRTVEFVSGRSDNTGRGLLYRVPAGMVLKTVFEQQGKKEELRFQWKGAQTVLPPSRHPEGNLYSWKKDQSPGVIEAALAPAWLLDELSPRSANGKLSKSLPLKDVISGTQEGGRASAATSLIGRMLLNCIDLTNQSALMVQWELIKAWNERNNPPIDEGQLESIFNSILRSEKQRREKQDQDRLSSIFEAEVEASVQAKAALPVAESSTNGKINGHSHAPASPEEPPADLCGWDLVIIESDPKEFRLRAPQWADSPRLHKGYVILTEEQIRIWDNSRGGIPHQVYMQSLRVAEPKFKDWAKPGGVLEKLTEHATIREVAPEQKKNLYMLGFFYRYISDARLDVDANGKEADLPAAGRPTMRKDGSIVFKLEHLKGQILNKKEDFKIKSLTAVIKEYGVDADFVQASRWWIVPAEVVEKIGMETKEGIRL